MVVNSITFWLFFAAVLLPYYTLWRGDSSRQNTWLLLASLIFYGWTGWRLVGLLCACIVVFYGLGLWIDRLNRRGDERGASRVMWLGVALGVGVLSYFKYLGFFVSEVASLLSALGLGVGQPTLHIVMPIGISFFTFKLIGYVIEVQRETLQPCRSLVSFGLFVSFFPTILSGPIDTATRFLPQLERSRAFDYDQMAEGMKRVLWGLFLKMCIADLLTGYVSAILDNSAHHNTPSLILAFILYACEMYTDFCGYSEMAIGVGQMLGLTVAENFTRPIFAQNIAEYWRRWHITLTSWITTYIYMPLNVAFRDKGLWGICLATLINTVAIGAWHGANWTYLAFGLYHGLLLVVIVCVEKRRKKLEKQYRLKKNPYYKWARILLTFVLVDIGMVLFRSPSVNDFCQTLGHLGNGWGSLYTNGLSKAMPALVAIPIMLLREYKDEHGLNIHFLHARRYWVRVVSTALLVAYIMLNGALDGASFLYFQF